MLALLALGVAQAYVVSAHHSGAAIYDDKKNITVKGVLSRVRWINPHALLDVEVKNADNTVTSWEFELHSPNEMQRIGWSRDMFKVGDHVTVDGSPARKLDVRRAFVTSVTLADGRKLSTKYDFGGGT